MYLFVTLATSRPFLLLDWLCFALVDPRGGGALGKHASMVLVQILSFPCRFGQKLVGWPLGKLATPSSLGNHVSATVSGPNELSIYQPCTCKVTNI